jgi:hypothetical protein
VTIPTLSQVDDPQASEADEFELIAGLENLYNMAKDKKQQYLAMWRRNYLLVSTRQNRASGNQPWSANVTDSEIFPILSSRIAWITDQRIQFDVAPEATPGSPWSDHMTVLGTHMQQLLDTNWQVQGWDTEVLLSLWDSAMFGAGIVKAVWDAGADSGMGNAGLKRVDVWKFYPDPNATRMSDAEYFFEVNRMSFAEIERRFPTTSQTLIADALYHGDGSDNTTERPVYAPSADYPLANPGNLPGSNASVYGLPGQSRRSGADQSIENGVYVKECWIRQNRRTERETTDPTHGLGDEDVVYDEWRVVVYTGHTVLLDELAVNLWQHDRHPYERFVDEEIGEFWPTPITSHLAPCQIAIDRLLSSIQGNAELIGNPVFRDVTGSGLTRTQMMNRPGMRVEVNSQAMQQGGGPGWLTPPELPQFVMSTVQFWIGRMENISGLSGPQKGQPATGRPAQQTVQATQEAGFVRIRSALRNLERTLSSIGDLLANLIVQNYDVPRVVAIVGDDGMDTAIRLAAQHFYIPKRDLKGKLVAEPLKFSLVVKCGSAAPTSRQARIAEADALFAMHAIDPQAVLQAHAWPNWQAVVARMQQAAQAQAAAQAQQRGSGGQGQPRGPGTGHPH